MADAKITALTENTTPLVTDIIPMVDDPGTTPLTQKITFSNVAQLVANPISDDGDSLGTTALKWSDLFLASGAVINHNSGSSTITGGANIFTFGGSGANGNGIVLPAGGTSIAPLVMTSGTNLSSAASGAVEYDGKVFYSTPVASARGLSPSTMFAIVEAGDFALATTAGVQSAFPATKDVWTLAASTAYFVEGQYRITHSVTACTVAIAFAAAGGLTITSMGLSVQSAVMADNGTATASNTSYGVQLASTVVTISSTANFLIIFQGIIRVNAGGTLTPQVNWSANTTGPAMKVDSYIKFTPYGTNTTNLLGNVA